MVGAANRFPVERPVARADGFADGSACFVSVPLARSFACGLAAEVGATPGEGVH